MFDTALIGAFSGAIVVVLQKLIDVIRQRSHSKIEENQSLAGIKVINSLDKMVELVRMQQQEHIICREENATLKARIETLETEIDELKCLVRKGTSDEPKSS